MKITKQKIIQLIKEVLQEARVNPFTAGSQEFDASMERARRKDIDQSYMIISYKDWWDYHKGKHDPEYLGVFFEPESRVKQKKKRYKREMMNMYDKVYSMLKYGEPISRPNVGADDSPPSKQEIMDKLHELRNILEELGDL